MKKTFIKLLFITFLFIFTNQKKLKSTDKDKNPSSTTEQAKQKTQKESYLQNSNLKEEKLNMPIKCIFADKFTLYDLRPLAKTKKDYDGYDYKIIIDKQQILFNFCQNLNEETCPNLNVQAALFSTNQCNALAGDYNNGANWEIKKLDNDTVNSITITLPKGKGQNRNVIYQLECDNNKKNYTDVKFDLITEKSHYTDDEVLLYFKTYHACAKVDFYRFWKFVNDNYIIFAVLLIVIGLMIAFVGQKFLIVTIFIVVIVSFVLIVMLCLFTWVIPSTIKNWAIWVILAVTAAVGAVIAYFVAKYKDKILGILFGVICGFWLGEFIYDLFANKITWNPVLVHWLIIIGLIIIMCILGIFFITYIVIISTSIIGAYLAIRGVSVLCGYFPNESTVMDLADSGEKEQLKKLFTWRVYLYLSSMVILAVLGMIVQFKLKKKEDEAKKQKEMEKGNDDEEKQNLLNK